MKKKIKPYKIMNVSGSGVLFGVNCYLLEYKRIRNQENQLYNINYRFVR